MKQAGFVVLMIFLLLGAFATSILDGIKGWRTVDTTEAFSVTTAAGVTTANVTLSRDLFLDDTAEVISISSNVTEVPIASTYTSATKVLLVAALNASATHTLTVNYYGESENTAIRAAGPFLGLIIIGGCIVVIFMGSKGKR